MTKKNRLTLLVTSQTSHMMSALAMAMLLFNASCTFLESSNIQEGSTVPACTPQDASALWRFTQMILVDGTGTHTDMSSMICQKDTPAAGSSQMIAYQGTEPFAQGGAFVRVIFNTSPDCQGTHDSIVVDNVITVTETQITHQPTNFKFLSDISGVLVTHDDQCQYYILEDECNSPLSSGVDGVLPGCFTGNSWESFLTDPAVQEFVTQPSVYPPSLDSGHLTAWYYFKAVRF